jgi:hypothetical protein
MSIWLDWDQMKDVLEGKDIYFFGAGIELVEKTIQKVNRDPVYILDNSPNMQRTKLFNRIEVIPPEDIRRKGRDIVILITTTAIEGVEKQMNAMGFYSGIELFCSPVLYNQKIEYDIKNNQETLIFTCSDGVDPDSPNSGGGLYTFHIKTGTLTKHYSGRFRQIAQSEDYCYIADAIAGIQVFDKRLNHVSMIPALPGSIMHGLAYNKDEEVLYVANTGRDSISIICANSGDHLEEIHISRPNRKDQVDRHHINDLCYYEGNLFISMFSFNGLWRNGGYDGGIALFDIDAKQVTGYPIQGMWMPHSVCFINGDIVTVDSMRGDVYKTSNKKLVNINGFVRGITYDGNYYYIGQSEHRHFDRLKDIGQVIHLNCGIHVFDENTKICRFYSFDKLANIHSISLKQLY